MDEKYSDAKSADPTKLEETGEGNGKSSSAVILRDGLAVFPQPTSDPLDPLNWSFTRKHSILAIVCLKYFLFTYITTTT